MNLFLRKFAIVILVLSRLLVLQGESTWSGQTTGPSQQELTRAYETSCVSNLRAINGAQGAYWGGDPVKGYARTLKELGPTGAHFLEPVIASGKKDGYRFRFVPEHTARNQPIRHYTITASPLKRLVKDQRSFFTDETGVIRFTTENRAATPADPPLDSAARQ
jgi:hypothetical protein